MTQPPRDVPPTRPVGEPVEGEVVGDSGLGAAARAVADAVAGLLGGPVTGGSAGRTARAAGGVLADVATALAAAARSARDPGGTGSGRSRRTGAAGAASGGLLGELLDAAAPRLPIRDRARLRSAHPGLTDSQIADALVARAARLTGGIGAATGGLAAAEWFAPPALLAVPLELGAQTVLTAAVELVLVGELHELAGRPAPGDARERARSYLTSWTTQRAVGTPSSGGLLSTLGTAGAAALRRRITRRLARGTTSMAPLLVGATLAARGNRKATTALGTALRADLHLDR